MSNWMKDLHNDHKKALKKIKRLRAELDDATKWNHSVRVCKDHTADIVDGECVICELADALKNESHYAKEIIEKDKRIEELKLEMGQWVRAMGLLTTMKPDLEIDAEHPGLMAREIFKWVAEKEDQIRNMDFDISHLQNECSEKDKRIGELEQDRERGLEERGYHIITTDQIDAAWSDAWRKYQGTNSTAGFSSLEKVGIVACGGCGGSGKAEYPLEGNYGPCPSCHGHGWKKT